MTFPFLYQRLGYVALGVTDLNSSIDFYRDLLGLDLTTDDSPKQASFRCSERASNVVLRQSEVAGLQSIGMQLQSAAELDKAKIHFDKLGYTIKTIDDTERSFLQVSEAFRVVEPISGVSFDFFHAMRVQPKEFSASLAKIQRLGHVVLRTTQFDELWATMENDFGLVTSDYVEDKGVWMRCPPNPFHHSFAIINSSTNGLHHVNFMVSEIDDVGRGRNRLMDAGVDIVYGPGRHKPSGSVFLYFTDPDDLTLEYSYGMEEFPAENAREPRMLTNSPDVMDLWGGLPKPAFGANGSILKP